MPRLGFALVVLALPLAAPAQEKVTRADLKPGLVLTVTDAGAKPFTVSRVEPAVGLTLADGEAPHPRSDGGATFRWEGYLNVLQAGAYRFDATLIGKLTVTVGGKRVYAATGTGDDPKAAKLVPGREVELPAGLQPFVAEFARTGPAARVELIWKGPGFRTEPVPHFFFGHLPKQRPASFAADLAREHGRFLFEEHSCGRCHMPAADDPMAKTLADRAGPNLSEVGRRAYPGWLDAWLADPHQVRPDTVMPKMFADDAAGRAERYAVVAYLASLGGPPPEPKFNPKQGDYARSVADGGRLYVTSGCAACHGEQVTQRPAKKKADDEEDPKPAAKPEDSAYAAGTNGPAGFYLLGAVGSKFTPESLARYLRDPLATNPHGRMPNMVLTPQEAEDLARFLCRQTDETIEKGMPPEPKMKPGWLLAENLRRYSDVSGPVVWKSVIEGRSDAEKWRMLGSSLFASKGCVNCHEVTAKPGPKPPWLLGTKTGMSDIRNAGSGKGCLADEPNPAKVPAYHLDGKQKADLAAFLKDGLDGPGSQAPAYQARLALRRFNCLACHNRDGEGGFSPELADRMRLLEKAENADDVSPPRLTGVGHKVRTSWMTRVLTQAGRARPWMTLRMPQYGNAHVAFLADALPKLEGTTADDTAGKVPLTAAKVEAGRALAGKAGHGCISCHDVSGITGGGTRGPDLARTHERVRFDWYTRWMHQPQRLAPGTRMPQAFLDGKALLTTYFDGDGDKQIEALWAYFSLGPGLPLPAGVEPPKGLVVAVKDRPEVLRTFMPDGAGSKAIAVGYPGGVSVVFDAAQCRLGYAWGGNFLDATPVWNNRGGNPAKILGPKFWEAPPGFPWAVTDRDGPPPRGLVERAADPAFGAQLPDDRFYGGPRYVRFDGYDLDSGGRPTFRYRLTDSAGETVLTVAETPAPEPVTVAAGLTRRFVVEQARHRTGWLWAGTTAGVPRAYSADGPAALGLRGLARGVPAVGTRLVLPQDGGKAVVLDASAAPAGLTWRFVRRSGGGWDVFLTVPTGRNSERSEFAVTVWGLPRDDEALVKGLRKK